MDCLKIKRVRYNHYLSHYEDIVGKDVNNYIIGSDDLKSIIKKDIKDYETTNKRSVRGNGCVLLDWAIQLPKELENDENAKKKFFDDSVKFFTERYKDKGFIVKGFVHNIEIDKKTGTLTRPHIHLSVVPYGRFEDRKSKKERIGFCADDYTRKKEFINIHKDFYKFMTNSFGYELKGLKKQHKETHQERELRIENQKLKDMNLCLRSSISYFKDNMKEYGKEANETVDKEFKNAILDTQKVFETKYKKTLPQGLANFFNKVFGFVFKQNLTKKKEIKHREKDEMIR